MFEHFKVINLNLFTQFLSFLLFDRFLTLHVCPKQFFVCVLVFTFYVIIDLLHLLICERNMFCIILSVCCGTCRRQPQTVIRKERQSKRWQNGDMNCTLNIRAVVKK